MSFHSGIFDSGHYFVIHDKSVLVKKDCKEKENPLPDKKVFQSLEKSAKDFFYEDNYDYSACFLSSKEDAPEGYEFIFLRELFFRFPELINLSSRAKGILNFRNTYRFCPTCGKPFEDDKNESALSCPECRNQLFPRIEPCIIALVSKGDEVLLVRHTYRNQNIFACISGFMELGETAEQCVKREVKEETGISVKNIVYKGSQSWPFPDQLMFAYTCDYESGELKLQENEIAEAKWFKRNELPSVSTPKEGSVAYRLINNLF